MKATGIVRRIDELGRLVIPKEIRRSLHIRESDSIEIYTDQNGDIVLRKYARMRELGEYAPAIVQSLSSVFNCTAALTDTETVLAAYGSKRNRIQERRLSESLSSSIRKRKSLVLDETRQGAMELFAEPCEPFAACCVVPIVAEGDPVGSILLFWDESRPGIEQTELLAQKWIVTFLGKLLEQ